jgi:hypothetical protein
VLEKRVCIIRKYINFLVDFTFQTEPGSQAIGTCHSYPTLKKVYTIQLFLYLKKSSWPILSGKKSLLYPEVLGAEWHKGIFRVRLQNEMRIGLF